MSEWNPGYYDKKGIYQEYEKRWYCNYLKIIHGSEKEFKQCKHCNKTN